MLEHKKEAAVKHMAEAKVRDWMQKQQTEPAIDLGQYSYLD